MRPARLPAIGLMLVLCGLMCSAVARAQSRAMDTGHSTLKVRVFKSGMFSVFAHDHEIEAAIMQGSVNLSTKPSIDAVDARKWVPAFPKIAPMFKDHGGSPGSGQHRFTEISFDSTAGKQGEEHWTVHGNQLCIGNRPRRYRTEPQKRSLPVPQAALHWDIPISILGRNSECER